MVYKDVRERRIPNWATLPGVLAGLALSAVEVGGFPGLALLGALVALGLGFMLFALGGVGAGDAKLFAAVGAFVGPGGLLPVLIYGGLAGGVLAVGSSLRQGVTRSALRNTKDLLVHVLTLGRYGERRTLDSPEAHSVPYGVAIAVGAVAALLFPLSLGGGVS